MFSPSENPDANLARKGKEFRSPHADSQAAPISCLDAGMV
jgi:hypothetical protein